MPCSYWGLNYLFCSVHRSRDFYFFNGTDNPKNWPFPWGISTPSTCNTWFFGYLDRFSRVCTVRQRDEHTDRHIDTQTTLRMTSVTIGLYYAMHAMRPNNWCLIIDNSNNSHNITGRINNIKTNIINVSKFDHHHHSSSSSFGLTSCTPVDL